jgi:hypothetical protein
MPPLVVLAAAGIALGLVLSGESSTRPNHCPSGASGESCRAGSRAGSASSSAGKSARGAVAKIATSALASSSAGAGNLAASTGTGAGRSSAGAGSASGTTRGGGGLRGASASEGAGAASGVSGAVNAGPAGAPAGGASGAPAQGAAGSSGEPTVIHVGASTPAGVLESGQSESGTWATESTIPTAMEPHLTAATITFPVALKRYLPETDVQYVDAAEAAKKGDERSAVVRERCGTAGTVEKPTALPGHLCVYAAVEDFRDRTTSGAIPLNAHGAPFIDAEFVAIVKDNGSEGANRTGARVGFGVLDIRTPEEEAAGAYPHIIARGSWAVTAP